MEKQTRILISGEQLLNSTPSTKQQCEENKMSEQNYPQGAEPTTEVSLDEKDLAIATEETPTKKTNNSAGEVLGMEDMGSTWIPNPVVGEETEVLTIKQVRKNANTTGKKKDGTTFSTALSSVDYKIDIDTDKGIYCPGCWEVWGKIKAAIKKNNELTRQTIVGTQFKVAHVINGGYASKKVEDVRKLEELPKTPEGLAQAQAIVDEAKAAQKSKKCYCITLFVGDEEFKY